MIWNKEMECADRDTMRALQLEKLKKTVKHGYDNVPHYKEAFDKAGLKPEDIKSLEDITKLPFITKEDIATNYPTGLFAVPNDDIKRIHASSGTTGKPKIVGYTQSDLDMWGECVARGFSMAGADKSDIIQVAYGYGLFTGGLGAHIGAETLGAMVIPMSSGNTQKQIMFMQDMKSTVLCCTPSYALTIAEQVEKAGLVPGKDIIIITVDGEQAAIDLLKAGKVNAVIIDNEPAKSFVAANEGLKILDAEWTVEDYAICVAKENTELLDGINGALAELEAEGKIDEIINRYISD